MTGWADLDWLFWVGGVLLGCGAAMLFAWALFVDRGRKKRRCPKCWYDMAGVPGMRCPECGRHARREGRLRKSRRRWRWAAVAALVGMGAYGVASVPAWRKAGWVGIVPATVLVYVAPVQEPPVAAGSSVSVRRGSNKPSPPWQRQIGDELWKRLQDGRLAHWQSQAYLRRYMQVHAIDLFEQIELPPRWPIGSSIPVRSEGKSIAGLPLEGRSPGAAWVPVAGTMLSPMRSAAHEVAMELGLRADSGIVYQVRRRLPIDVQRTRETLMDHIDSAVWDPKIAAAMAPHLSMSFGTPVVILHDRTDHVSWDPVRFIVAYSLEVRVGDRVIGAGKGRVPWKDYVWTGWEEAQISWSPGAVELLKDGAAAVIAVRGSPADAADAFMSQPFGYAEPVCWAGEFSARLEMREHPREK